MMKESCVLLEGLNRIKGFQAIVDNASDNAMEITELLIEVRLIRIYACIYPTDINIACQFHSGCSGGRHW
jgi:hypothetical protein